MTKPYVVILGAGASIAAIPNGDKNGKKTSVMNGFIDVLDMRDIIDELNLKTKSDNLEDIFSELSQNKKHSAVCKELEAKIYDYFAEMEIPDHPTVYDFLLLSLTSKDLIATFNWDPLLLQAYQRVHKITTNLPELAFLHGNVLYGCCDRHKKKTAGYLNQLCPTCGYPLQPSKLLFPVAEKDYKSDQLIEHNWKVTQAYIKEAFMITIFGYSAPKTDKSAIDLLQQAWGKNSNRQYEEVSIIDILSEDQLTETWDSFIFSHHFRCSTNFFDSYLGFFPRRSCEAVFDMFFGNRFQDNRKGFKQSFEFDDIESFIIPLLEVEENHSTEDSLPNPYR